MNHTLTIHGIDKMCTAIGKLSQFINGRPTFTEYLNRYVISFEEKGAGIRLDSSLIISREIQYGITGKQYVEMVLSTERIFANVARPIQIHYRKWNMFVETINNPIDLVSEIFTMLHDEDYTPYERTDSDYAKNNFAKKTDTTVWTNVVQDFDIYNRFLSSIS